MFKISEFANLGFSRYPYFIVEICIEFAVDIAQLTIEISDFSIEFALAIALLDGKFSAIHYRNLG